MPKDVPLPSKQVSSFPDVDALKAMISDTSLSEAIVRGGYIAPIMQAETAAAVFACLCQCSVSETLTFTTREMAKSLAAEFLEMLKESDRGNTAFGMIGYQHDAAIVMSMRQYVDEAVKEHVAEHEKHKAEPLRWRITIYDGDGAVMSEAKGDSVWGLYASAYAQSVPLLPGVMEWASAAKPGSILRILTPNNMLYEASCFSL